MRVRSNAAPVSSRKCSTGLLAREASRRIGWMWKGAGMSSRTTPAAPCWRRWGSARQRRGRRGSGSRNSLQGANVACCRERWWSRKARMPALRSPSATGSGRGAGRCTFAAKAMRYQAFRSSSTTCPEVRSPRPMVEVSSGEPRYCRAAGRTLCRHCRRSDRVGLPPRRRAALLLPSRRLARGRAPLRTRCPFVCAAPSWGPGHRRFHDLGRGRRRDSEGGRGRRRTQSAARVVRHGPRSSQSLSTIRPALSRPDLSRCRTRARPRCFAEGATGALRPRGIHRAPCSRGLSSTTPSRA